MGSMDNDLQQNTSAIQDTFVSSTFWTERLGFTAALATLENFNVLVHNSLVKSGEKVNAAYPRQKRTVPK